MPFEKDTRDRFCHVANLHDLHHRYIQKYISADVIVIQHDEMGNSDTDSNKILQQSATVGKLVLVTLIPVERISLKPPKYVNFSTTTEVGSLILITVAGVGV